MGLFRFDYTSRVTGKKTDLSRERVDVNVVTWDTQFHDPSTRKLINEARGICHLLLRIKTPAS